MGKISMGMLYSVITCLQLTRVFAGQIQYPVSSHEFNAMIDQHQYTLAYFRQETRSCPDCDRVLAELIDASKYVDNQQIAIACVNCTVCESLCEPFKVPEDYPCLKFFDSTTVIDYHGNYDRDAIVFNLRRLSGPILTNLQTGDDVKDFFARYNDTMIMFMHPDDSDSLVAFASAATHLRANVTFGYSTIPVLSEINVKVNDSGNPVLVFNTPLRIDPALFVHKEISVASLEKFLFTERFPVIGNMSPEVYSVYFDRGLPIVWCFLAPDDRKTSYLEILHNVANKSRSQFSWVWLDAVKHYSHALNLGLNFPWPGIVIDDTVSKTKYIYPLDHPFDVDSLSEWIENVQSNQVKAAVRSEKPFPISAGSLIVRAVGVNFGEIISDLSKDVFIVVTSKSWCGPCKVVDPQVLALARIFKDQSSVLIVEIDGSLNDVPLNFENFPSIFFYGAGNRSDSIFYRGIYSYNAFTDFILQHSRTVTSSQRQAVLSELKLMSSRPKPPSTLIVNLNSERDEL